MVLTRLATTHDLEAIYNLAESLTVLDADKGFLLKKPFEYYQSKLNSNTMYVAYSNDYLVGYALVLPEIGQSALNNISCKDYLASIDYVYLDNIASIQKGVGRLLLDRITEDFKGKYLVSAVVSYPLPNKASLKYHRHVKFNPEGLYHDSDGDKSVIFVKELV